MRPRGPEADYRAKRREHYFEDSKYRKWSYLERLDSSYYGNYRERAFLKYYLCENKFGNDRQALLNMHEVLANGKSHPINWVAFYAYFDERLNDPENPLHEELTEEIFPWLDDSPTVIGLLNQYRETLLLPDYDMV